MCACVLIASGHAAAATATTATAPTYNRLFYYQRNVNSTQSFLFHYNQIDVFAPQVYQLNVDGTLTGGLGPILQTFTREHAIQVMPLVTNGNFSQSVGNALLDDPTKQASAIQALVDEAKLNGYIGWQIDFEQIDASYKDKFSAFVKNAYAAMRQNNLQLSVAVISKTSDVPTDYGNNIWQTLVGAYDYDALAANSDFLSIMSYDDPNSLGPVAEYSWLQQVIAYSLAHVPKEKISLGIPLYYWKWNDTTGEFLGSGGVKSFEKTLKKYKVTKHYSTEQHMPYLTYMDKGQKFFVWYENAKSISEKIALIKKNGLYGFSAWALGQEMPDVWNSVRK